MSSQAEVSSYMDIDLSTDLEAYPRLIDAIARDDCDLAVASRLLPKSQVTRGLRREFLSRGCSQLMRWALGLGVYDAQCGFKAISRRAAQALLPRIEDTG